MKSNMLHSNIITVIPLLFCINLYCIIIFGPHTFSLSIFSDNGAISILVILFVLLAQFLAIHELFTADKIINKLDWFLFVYLLEIYVLREADFHRTFTSTNISKLKFYLDANNPLLIKWIAGPIFIVLILAVFYLAAKYMKLLVLSVKKRIPWANAGVLWFLLLFCSQIFDKLPMNESEDLRIKFIEEMMEFTAAIYLLLALILYKYAKSSRYNDEIIR